MISTQTDAKHNALAGGGIVSKRTRIVSKMLLTTMLRNPMTMFWNFVFPIFLLVLYRAIFGSKFVGQFDFMTWVVPGILVMNNLSFGLIGSTALVLKAREDGVLQRIRVSPMPTGQLVRCFLIANFVTILVQSILVMLTSAIFYGWRPSLAALAVGSLLSLFTGVVSLIAGQALANVAGKQATALAIAQLIYFTQLFLGGLVYPSSELPSWLSRSARFLPGAAMGQMVREPFLSNGIPLFDTAITIAYGVPLAVIAIRLFSWEPRP